jgi:hypothetical protein
MTPISEHIEKAVDPDREIAQGLAAPDNLHELLSGVPTVNPVDEPADLPPLAIANEPLPADEPPPAPAPKPTAKRKPKAAAENSVDDTDAAGTAS